MAKRDFVTKDFALYVVHYFASMQTWSKQDILAEIDRTIKEAKPEDAVRVVRCKDCRWSREKDHREPTDTTKDSLICQCCMNHHIPAPWGARLAVKPEHFCSYGERKDNVL